LPVISTRLITGRLESHFTIGSRALTAEVNRRLRARTINISVVFFN
jgi:hypothetical protein